LTARLFYSTIYQSYANLRIGLFFYFGGGEVLSDKCCNKIFDVYNQLSGAISRQILFYNVYGCYTEKARTMQFYNFTRFYRFTIISEKLPKLVFYRNDGNDHFKNVILHEIKSIESLLISEREVLRKSRNYSEEIYEYCMLLNQSLTKTRMLENNINKYF
jgi:hypothetical protein